MEVKKFTEKVNEEFTPSSIFKLGLDYHGVVDALPEAFAFLSESVVKNGGEVHILTGGSWSEESSKKLKSLGLTWTHHFSIYDYLISSDAEVIGEVTFPDGTVQKKFQDGLWDHIKGEYCRTHQITLHIDDTLIYNDYFTTPFARLWTHNNRPKLSHKDSRHIA